MGKIFKEIVPPLEEWIAQQNMFFVSTAPLDKGGLVNCSPKGLDTFRILNPTTVAYLDLTGSGVETIAHIAENQRITIMFCAFSGPPKILRLYGEGEVILRGSESFEAIIHHFPSYLGARSIVKIRLKRIADSCGYSVPNYDFVGQRDVGLKWAERKGEEGIKNYIKERNGASLDGLPAIK